MHYQMPGTFFSLVFSISLLHSDVTFITYFCLDYAITRQLTSKIWQLCIAFVLVHWPLIDPIPFVWVVIVCTKGQSWEQKLGALTEEKIAEIVGVPLYPEGATHNTTTSKSTKSNFF
jgi:hypothetical protein